MQSYNKYLKGLTQSFPSYSLSSDDKQSIATGGIAQWIFRKITRQKFRKAAISPETKAELLKKLSASVKKAEPIHFVVCFGGYKHFWNPSHPRTDWAEIFNLSFMCDFVSPILAAYSPGVNLDYSSDDIIITKMNNYPKSSLNEYQKSFNQLLSLFTPTLPSNLKISYVRAKNHYSEQILFSKIDTLIEKYKNRFNNMTIKQKNNSGFFRSARNMMWRGEYDLTNLSSRQKKERVEESKIIEDAYYEADFGLRGQYISGNSHIPIVLSWGLSQNARGGTLTLGSTYGSQVDFWIGRGILEDRTGKLIPRILSHNQYDQIKSQLVLHEGIPVPLKTLQQIEVFPGKLPIRNSLKFHMKPLQQIKQLILRSI